jgi:hypothetical protein
MHHLRVDWKTVPRSSGCLCLSFACRFTTLSTVRCGNSLPDVGREVSSSCTRIPCRGTSRSSAVDFSNRTALGLMLMKRPRLPFAVMSSAISPQISPERMPVGKPNKSALCSTLSLVFRKLLTCVSLAPHGDEPRACFDLDGLPRVGSQFPLANTPAKELDHLLRDTGLGLRHSGTLLLERKLPLLRRKT